MPSTCSKDLITPGSLSGVRVFFPDPWPKARHHKRRLLQPAHGCPDRRSAPSSEVCCTPPPTIPATPSRSPRSVTPNPGCVRVGPGLRRTGDLGRPPDYQVREQGAACRQRRHRIGVGAPPGKKPPMSLTEETTAGPTLDRSPRRRDCPGLMAGVGSSSVSAFCWCGTRRTSTWAWDPSWAAGPTALERPRFDALGRWLLARTAEVAAGQSGRTLQPSPKPPCSPTSRRAAPKWCGRGWMRCVTWGSPSSPNPKSTKTAMSTATCSTTSRSGVHEGLAALVVASADGQAFRLPLEEISRGGVPVQVLGFREHASWALASDTLEFVDLEDIAGVFREPLPRIGLDSLPEQGAWLQPFRPLSSLLTSRV